MFKSNPEFRKLIFKVDRHSTFGATKSSQAKVSQYSDFLSEVQMYHEDEGMERLVRIELTAQL